MTNYTSTLIGYPYIGENREWKKLLERFWQRKIDEQHFEQEMKEIRLARIDKQLKAGIDLVTVGDFTYYDRVLDVALMFGLVPKRFDWHNEMV